MLGINTYLIVLLVGILLTCFIWCPESVLLRDWKRRELDENGVVFAKD